MKRRGRKRGGHDASRRRVLVGGAAAWAGLYLAGAPRTAAAAILTKGSEIMTKITTKDGVDIFYKDWGKGQPIVFSHGWPLSADDWDTQMMFFLG